MVTVITDLTVYLAQKHHSLVLVVCTYPTISRFSSNKLYVVQVTRSFTEKWHGALEALPKKSTEPSVPPSVLPMRSLSVSNYRTLVRSDHH